MKDYFYTIVHFDGNNTSIKDYDSDEEAFKRYEEIESTDPVYLELSRTCNFNGTSDTKLIKKYLKGIQSK